MGQYVSYIEAALTMRHPEKHYEFINIGLPSETVSGLSEPNHAGGSFPRPDLHERLERILEKTKPDLVFACYGMNDGIFMPYDEGRFHKYIDGINWLHDRVIQSGASIIHITPPIYDERKGQAYANVLDLYSDWLLTCRYSQKWNVIDIHWPMKKYLEEQRSVDSTFMYAKDGVHPDELGHFIMAKQILLFLGESFPPNAIDIKSALSNYKNSDAIIKLIEGRQEIMKDAWLTYIGHKRPGMKVGVSIDSAKHEYNEIGKQIQELQNANN
jgi:lysophospholipase L1-like esterase